LAPRPEVQQAAQRNGQHEQVDEQQVERKHPDRAAQVALVDVLHHHHLELARQEHHRQHGQQHQPEPLRARQSCPPCSRRSSCCRSARLRAGEQVAQAVEQAPGDEDADRQEGHQLDHRLERDGRHHALVALGGVEVPRAEGTVKPASASAM
jgi:hypothetical protein